MALEFNGFPEDGLRFLRQLKLHNDRDWFRERKSSYDEYVEQPMRALVQAVAADCQSKGLPLYAKEKSPVMRVYRDIRFSKDKLPYKTHVAAELRRSFRDSSVMLYLHFSPAESLLGAGVWQPERPLLHAWRDEIVRQPKRFEKTIAALAKKDLELVKEHSLSMMPRGFQNYADESFGASLKLTSFVVRRDLAPAEVIAPEIVHTVVDFALAAKPLLEFGWQVEEARAR